MTLEGGDEYDGQPSDNRGPRAGLTIIGGALVLLEISIYFGNGGVFGSGAPELTDVGGWGFVTGIFAVLGDVVGALVMPLSMRIFIGCVCAAGCSYVSEGIGLLAPEVIDVVAGSEEARLEDEVSSAASGSLSVPSSSGVWSAAGGRWRRPSSFRSDPVPPPDRRPSSGCACGGSSGKAQCRLVVAFTATAWGRRLQTAAKEMSAGPVPK